MNSYHSARINTPSSNYSNTFNSTLNALDYLSRAETSRVENDNLRENNNKANS